MRPLTKRNRRQRNNFSATRFEAVEPRMLLAVNSFFVSTTGTLLISGSDADDAVEISRDSTGRILVNDISVSNASVTNTNSILVNSKAGKDVVTIDQTNGVFGPGKSSEASGISEIEFDIDFGAGDDRLILIGTPGNDKIKILQNGVSYNPDPDVDIDFENLERITVLGRDGNDFISAASSLLTGPVLKLFGGPGNDALINGFGVAELNGGGGSDKFETAQGPVIVVGGSGVDSWKFTGTFDDDSVLAIAESASTLRIERQVDGVPIGNDFVSETEYLGILTVSGSDVIDFSGPSLAQLGSIGISAIALSDDNDNDVDTIRGSQGPDYLDGGPGDSIFGFSGDDRLVVDSQFGSLTRTRLFGGAGNDEIAVESLSPILAHGGGGDDRIVSIHQLRTQEGDRTIVGGPGIDHLDLSYTVTVGRSAQVVARRDANTQQLLISQSVGLASSNELVSEVEKLELNQALRSAPSGGGFSNQFGFGGLGGFNQFGNFGGLGGFNQFGGFGSGFGGGFGQGGGGFSSGAEVIGDRINFSLLTENDRQLLGLNEIKIVMYGKRKDDIQGSQGRDEVISDGGADFVGVNGGNDRVDGGAGADLLLGNGGSDELFGGSENDNLFGGVGNDKLFGEDGDDSLFGEDGNDTLDGGAGNNTLDEGPGQGGAIIRGTSDRDVIRISRTKDSLGVHVVSTINGEEQVQSYRNGETIIVFAGEGDDLVSFDAAAAAQWQAMFFGEAGDDTLIGGANSDSLYGGKGNDSLFGLDGNDILLGNEDDDQLFGGLGNDLLIGGMGQDRLVGGRGEDLLIGGRTVYDRDEQLLRAILGEWNSNRSYEVRLKNLQAGSGSILGKRDIRLKQIETVFDNCGNDRLVGGSGRDAFMAKPDDRVFDLRDDERVIQ